MTTDSMDARAVARALMSKHDPGSGGAQTAATAAVTVATTTETPVRRTDFRDHPGVVEAAEKWARFDSWATAAGVLNPYYLPHEGVSGARTRFAGRDMLNFSSFGYLDLAAEPRVQAAAAAAIDTYGTSAAAVRLVAGELPLYRELESELARIYDTDAAIVTSSGFLTNAAAVAFLLGKRDLAVCDSLIHNSIVSGTEWAGCRRVTFRHNDPDSLEAILRMSRRSFDRAMVLLEGVYSMDGDIVRLPEIIEVARRYDCSVMIDEAHSFGVLGERGLGARELFDLPGDAVDVWMGTLSKALGSVGGYLAANRELVDGFKYSAAGLSMYTASPAPSAAAAALEGLAVLHDEPQRVAALRHNSRYFLTRARELGFDTGNGAGTPITPIITGADEPAVRASMQLLEHDVMANAIGHPVVPAGQARLRFFVNCRHTEDQLDAALSTLRRIFDGFTTEEGPNS
ncbi:2-amino-3-ketobutyrate CoA ligase [Nocardia sp. 852002-20019_SCH5090214]|uniref:8-amino-7-oxononanoate synthase n=1 Tax=Nocardia nova TaxID=37330 RepID=A0A2S5ZZB4_9NOCA|nr:MULTISPECIES: aminotransferase class I/II-fold pyridoxal phosphate-dependent enzyme [Nocardia]OBA61483.1 2-amino-3-ketobutyrate CoA ligase [Nocardia sp. 852002-20019_SCH5090214]PPJ23848.1 2-amino-3-ketobutyrate CoA ligase [Nocardia nova]